MKDIVGKWVKANEPTFQGWKGIGMVVDQYQEIINIVPEGEDSTDRWKRKTYLRHEVSVLRNQNRTKDKEK